MRRLLVNGPVLLSILLLLIIFRNWFLVKEIIGGDWPYFFKETLLDIPLLPPLWATWAGNGMGNTNSLLNLQIIENILVIPFVQWLQIPWVTVYKIAWFGLFIICSFYFSFQLSKLFFVDIRHQIWSYITALIFTTNTYILMLLGGGQMGVAWAYALAPWVLVHFIKLIESVSNDEIDDNIKTRYPTRNLILFQKTVITGVVLALQFLFDQRIVYITLLAVGLFLLIDFLALFYKRAYQKIIQLVFYAILCPLIIVISLHAFWLLPLVLLRNNPLAELGSAYTSQEALRFFSFADFSHSMSFLHPNWPENIFGKTYFLKPEFLWLPFLVFLSLLLPKTKLKIKLVYFFALLGLLGVFLAKGSNEPFGNIYVFLFNNLPGFVMLRDPTKFYVLISISYSLLITLTLWGITDFIQNKFKKLNKDYAHLGHLITVIFVLFWSWLISPAIKGNLSGTLAKHDFPDEYVKYKNFILSQRGFSRTLWVPRQSRFAYGDLNHIIIEAEPLFSATSAAQLSNILPKSQSRELLADLVVKYIVVPYDSEGELFIDDRKYSENKRAEYERVLDGVPWLKKIQNGRITIYETPLSRDLFWLNDEQIIDYKQVHPSRYKVRVHTEQPEMLYFSQKFDTRWVANINDRKIYSQKSKDNLNSFPISSAGDYELEIYFEPQEYVKQGLLVSGVSLVLIIAIYISLVRARKVDYNALR